VQSTGWKVKKWEMGWWFFELTHGGMGASGTGFSRLDPLVKSA